MRFLDDPADMPPAQRLAELATILATGYLRARELAPDPTPSTEKRLDVAGQPRQPLSGGSTPREPAQMEMFG